jgi:hypothetical protein
MVQSIEPPRGSAISPTSMQARKLSLTMCLTGLRNSALDERHCSIAGRRTGGVGLDRSFEWRILRMMNDTPYNPTRARLFLNNRGQFADRCVGAMPVPTNGI